MALHDNLRNNRANRALQPFFSPKGFRVQGSTITPTLDQNNDRHDVYPSSQHFKEHVDGGTESRTQHPMGGATTRKTVDMGNCNKACPKSMILLYPKSNRPC